MLTERESEGKDKKEDRGRSRIVKKKKRKIYFLQIFVLQRHHSVSVFYLNFIFIHCEYKHCTSITYCFVMPTLAVFRLCHNTLYLRKQTITAWFWLKLTLQTDIWFVVSVPVLSEQMTDVQPRVSTTIFTHLNASSTSWISGGWCTDQTLLAL
jgi:uncharacterized membrane protein YfbV (UPF0208 family)